MAKKFLTNLDLNQNELLKARIENYAGTPVGAVTGKEGQIIWDSTNDKLYMHTSATANNTSWVEIAGGTGGATYSISAETVSGGANLRLTSSTPTTDDVKIASGTGITVTRTDVDTITISCDVTDTNWYPTTFAWTGGTTAGATGSLTGSGMSAVSFPALPSATGSASGVVTTTTQTFAGDKTFSNNVIVTGNLTVNGTTTTINSTVHTVDDPVMTLGGDTAPGADDNKDRGIEFRWHNGTVAKVGFFGFDDSTGKFTFIPDATNTSEVFSGTPGELVANIDWSNVINKPTVTSYNSFLGDGTTTEFVVTHNLSTRNLLINIWETDSPYGDIICDIERTTTNTVTFRFAVAPTTGQYTYLIARVAGA